MRRILVIGIPYSVQYVIQILGVLYPYYIRAINDAIQLRGERDSNEKMKMFLIIH